MTVRTAALVLSAAILPLESAAAQMDSALPEATRTQSVSSLFQHRDGALWIGTNYAGVFRYDGETFTRYSEKDGLSSDFVTSITADQQGHVWFGTDHGLSRFDGKEFETVAIPWDGNEDLWGKGMNANLVHCLLTDRRGRIWFGTWGNGAHSFDPSQRAEDGQYRFTSLLQNRGSLYGASEYRNVIQSIIEAADGSIWLTSMSHDGVTQWRDGELKNRSIQDGLSEDMVFSAHQSRDGAVWLGMLGNRKRGLNRLDGKNVTTYGVVDGLSSNNIISIHQDRNDMLWLGSQRGQLTTLRLASEDDALPLIQVFEHDGRSFSNIHEVSEDAEGRVWFGGGYGQLFRYDGERLVDLSGELRKAMR